MNKKTIFCDVETTGRSYKEHDIIQICMIIDIDGEIKETMSFNVRPFKNVFEEEALKVNGLKWQDVLNFEDPKEVYKKIVKVIEKYMPYEERGFYDDRDKFTLCAYNGKKFDFLFIKAWFVKNGDARMNRFFSDFLDPYDFLYQQKMLAKKCGYTFPIKSLKLTSLCERFDIPIENAHDATADTIGLRNLTYKLGELYKVFDFEHGLKQKKVASKKATRKK